MVITRVVVQTIVMAVMLSSPALAAPKPPPAQTRMLNNGRLQPAWFLCDGVDQPVAYAIGQPDKTGRLSILSIDKTLGGAPVVQTYKVGPADPGAGQINYALTRDGSEVGFLHSVNPDVYSDPTSLTLPPFVSIKLDQTETTCRMAPKTFLLGFDQRRSFLIVQGSVGGLAYRTIDFADFGKAGPVTGDNGLRTTKPSLAVLNGLLMHDGSAAIMIFTNQDYVYRVRIDSAGADVATIFKGRQIQDEKLVAYSVPGGL